MKPKRLNRGDRAFVVGILDNKVPNGKLVTLEKWYQSGRKWLVSTSCSTKDLDSVFYYVRETNLQHEDNYLDCRYMHSDLIELLLQASKTFRTQERCKYMYETYFSLMCSYNGIQRGSDYERKLLFSFLDWIGQEGDADLLKFLEIYVDDECGASNEFVQLVICPKTSLWNNVMDVGDFMRKARSPLIEQIELNRTNLKLLLATFKTGSNQKDVWEYMQFDWDSFTPIQSRKDVIGGITSKAAKQCLSIQRGTMKEQLIGAYYGDSLHLAYSSWMMENVLESVSISRDDQMLKPYRPDVLFWFPCEDWEDDLTSSFRTTAESISIELRAEQWNNWLDNFFRANLIPCIDVPCVDADRRLLRFSIFTELACQAVTAALSTYRELHPTTRLPINKDTKARKLLCESNRPNEQGSFEIGTASSVTTYSNIQCSKSLNKIMTILEI